MTTHKFEGEEVVLPDWKGQPYLWVQKKKPGGKAPDFTGTQPKKMSRMWREDLCGACGLPILGGSVYFITEEKTLRGKTPPFDCAQPFSREAFAKDGAPLIHLTEPQLHKTCARLAGLLCPVLRDESRGTPVIIEVPKRGLVIFTQSVGFGARAGHYPRRVLSALPIRKSAPSE